MQGDFRLALTFVLNSGLNDRIQTLGFQNNVVQISIKKILEKDLSPILPYYAFLN